MRQGEVAYRRFGDGCLSALIAAFLCCWLLLQKPGNHVPGHRISPFQKGELFRITGSGTAFNVTDRNRKEVATLDLMISVERASFGRAKISVRTGSLTIGGETFTVEIDATAITSTRASPMMMSLLFPPKTFSSSKMLSLSIG